MYILSALNALSKEDSMEEYVQSLNDTKRSSLVKYNLEYIVALLNKLGDSSKSDDDDSNNSPRSMNSYQKNNCDNDDNDPSKIEVDNTYDMDNSINFTDTNFTVEFSNDNDQKYKNYMSNDHKDHK